MFLVIKLLDFLLPVVKNIETSIIIFQVKINYVNLSVPKCFEVPTGMLYWMM